MQPLGNRKYSDGFKKREVTAPVSRMSQQPLQTLSNEDLAAVATKRRNAILARRLRRTARIMIAATKANASSKRMLAARRKKALLLTFANLKQNSPRFAAVSLVVIFAATTLVLPLLQANNEKLTQLNDATKQLVGKTRDDAATYLKYDAKTEAYTFAAPEQDKTDSYEHTGRNADAYSVTLPKKAKEGVTVTENQSKIAVTLTPQFFTTPAQKTDDNNIVYRSGERQMVYTLKYNGLKEDIIIPSFISENQQFGFRLSLPSGVEARKQDDGSIGIYSSDPTLFGDISFGSDEDRARVDKARENSEKTNLVMTIPFPVVKDGSGNEYDDRSNFELGDHKLEKRSTKAAGLPEDAPETLGSFNTYQLSVKAWNLKSLKYPISIDPTMRVTSSADFNKLNLEDGTELDTTNNLIKRASLTGGTVGSWNTDDPLPTAGGFHGLYYNGYYYLVSGNRVQYAPVDSAGNIGSWAETTSIGAFSNSHSSAVVYNGYMYYTGGPSNGQGAPSIYFSKMKPDGTLSAWSATGTAHNRALLSISIYDGFLYLMGGCAPYNATFPASCTNTLQVDSAPVRADGTLGSWANTNRNLPAVASDGAAVSFNGHIYLTRGGQGTSIYASAIGADGSLSDWSTYALPTGRTYSATPIIAVGGYLWLAGGHVNNELTQVMTAPINADGSIGGFRDTTGLPAARDGPGLATDGRGHLVYMGGDTGVFPANSSHDDVYTTTIKPAGSATNSVSGTTFTTARWGASVVVQDNMIYVFGGCTSAAVANNCISPLSISGCSGGQGANCTGGTQDQGAQHATINEDGSLSAWTNDVYNCKIGSWATGTGTACPTNRFGATAIITSCAGAYLNSIIIVGGSAGGLTANYAGANDTWRVVIGQGTILTPTTATQGQINISGSIGRGWATGFSNGQEFYVTGGNDTNGVVNTTLSNSCASAAGLAGWSVVTSSGSYTARTHHAGATYFGDGQKIIYVIGGQDGSGTTLGDINKGVLTGSTVTWTQLCSSCSGYTASYGAQAVIFRDKLIIAGGTTSGSSPPGSYNADIISAAISANGDIGNFSSIGSLATARYYFGMGISGQNLVSASGVAKVSGSDAAQNTSEYTKINYGGEGTQGAWTTGTGTLATARYKFGAAQYGKYLYSVGGNDSSENYLSDTQVGTIADDGTMSWVTASGITLPAGRAAMAAVAVSGYLYIMGGETSSDGTASGAITVDGKVYRAKIKSDGTLDSTIGVNGWTDTGTDLVDSGGAARNLEHTSALVGYAGTTPYIYVVGGRTTTSDNDAVRDIERTSVNTGNGSLGGWTGNVQANFLPADMRSIAAAAYKNAFYFVGGVLDYGSAGFKYQGASYATISQTTGALTLHSSMGIGPSQYAHGLGVMNGFLYTIGSNNFEWHTIIHSDSSMGDYVGASTAKAAMYGGYATYNGRFYLYGGCASVDTSVDKCFAGNFLNSWQYTSPKVIPRTASVSELYDFGTGVKPTKLITRGTKQTGATVGVNYSSTNFATSSATLDNIQTITDAGYAGPNAQTINLGTNRTLSRYLFLRYTIDDSQSAVFPDSGNESTITDFDLYYTANPGSRLRGGRTFTNGVDRGLDTQPQ